MLLVVFLFNFTVVYCGMCSNGRGGGCELFCKEENNDTRTCSCGELGEIELDGVSCYYKPRLIFGDDQNLVFLHETTILGSQVTMETYRWPVVKDSDVISSLAESYTQMKIFYTSRKKNGNFMIGYFDVRDRTHAEIYEENDNIYGITFDTINGKLYYTHGSGVVKVVSDYDTSIATHVEVFLKMISPHQIKIDSVAGLLFVTDFRLHSIIRVDIKTRNKSTILNDSAVPIALDLVAEKIFFMTSRTQGHSIEMMNYDGTYRELIKSVNSALPYTMSFWNNALFWLDKHFAKKKIYRTNIPDGRTIDMNVLIEGTALTVQYFGQKEDYTGEWSAWTSLANGTSTRKCNRTLALLPYNVSSLSPQREGKFKCVGIAVTATTKNGISGGKGDTILWSVIPVVCFIFLVIIVILIYKYKSAINRRVNPRHDDGNEIIDVPADSIYEEIGCDNAVCVELGESNASVPKPTNPPPLPSRNNTDKHHCDEKSGILRVDLPYDFANCDKQHVDLSSEDVGETHSAQQGPQRPRQSNLYTSTPTRHIME